MFAQIPPHGLHKVLAIDTSTDRLSLALGPAGACQRVWSHEGVGGAQSSSTLIPAIQALLAEAGWSLAELDAIAFGCGPGSFTGLRTACSVVQGLAVAARPGGIPVVPVNTLLAVAEQALWQLESQGLPLPERMLAMLDARMDEMYVAEVLVPVRPAPLRLVGEACLSAPEAVGQRFAVPTLLAGNALEVYGDRLPLAWQGVVRLAAWPTASAMLRLAPALWAQGLAVPAADAQPLYVRDKVAQTTEEREQIKAAKNLAAQVEMGVTEGRT